MHLQLFNNIHNFNLSFMETLEIKKYDINDRFGKHYANYLSTDIGIDRKLNLIVQLSEDIDYEGGDLYVLDSNGERLKFSKILGTLIIFPSNYLHGVSTIKKGSRYSLITHIWGPEFK